MPEKIRYYTDEHVAKAVIRGLRRRGVDVLTAPEADMLQAPDGEHLRLAATQGRVVVTQDDDFLPGRTRPGARGDCLRSAAHTDWCGCLRPDVDPPGIDTGRDEESR